MKFFHVHAGMEAGQAMCSQDQPPQSKNSRKKVFDCFQFILVSLQQPNYYPDEDRLYSEHEITLTERNITF